MARRPFARKPCGLRAFLRDESGAAALLLAIVFPVMIGGMALGAEAGYWFVGQRQLQQAADLAAHAAAVTKRSGGNETEMRDAALSVARGSGFEDGSDSLSLLNPPTSGAYAGRDDSVEIGIVRQQQRYFTQIYDDGPVPLRARAVAAVEVGSTACLLALSGSASGAVTISGSTEVSFDGCDMASNSTASDSFLMNSGAAGASTGCVNTVGGAVTTADLTLSGCDAVNEGAPPAADPYADIAEPDLTGTCESGSVGQNNQTTVVTPTESHSSGVSSMRFCSGLDVSGDVTFKPGLYLIEGGDFVINSNALVAGTDVTFFLADGVNLRFNGSATFQLSAPDEESNPYRGLLIFGSRTASLVQHQMNGAASSTLDGAIYTPASPLDFTGDFTGGGGGCTQIVADTVLFSGNSALAVNCLAAGTRPISVRQEVRLVE